MEKNRTYKPTARTVAIATVFALALGLAAIAESDGAKPVLKKTVRKIETAALPYSTIPVSKETADFLSGAYAQIGVTVRYDPAYAKLDFPMGDVPKDRGVCTDVVIRAFRGIGVDLQAEVNADMKANFSKYPTKYGLFSPDANIDHRRVPNLMTYFDRKGWSKEMTQNPADYLPGDIVAWNFPRNQTHIGIVSDRVSNSTGIPLIFSNSWRGTLLEDILFEYEIIGHYRK